MMNIHRTATTVSLGEPAEFGRLTGGAAPPGVGRPGKLPRPNPACKGSWHGKLELRQHFTGMQVS